MVTRSEDAFAGWAIVEVVGRKQYAGLVREQLVAGTPLLRVDVPEVTAGGVAIPAFTKFVGPGSIYMLTPTDEETARAVATSLRERPVHLWQMPASQAALERARFSGVQVGGSTDESDTDWDDDNPDSDEDIPDGVNDEPELCGANGGQDALDRTIWCELEEGHTGEHASPNPENLNDLRTWPRTPEET